MKDLIGSDFFVLARKSILTTFHPAARDLAEGVILGRTAKSLLKVYAHLVRKTSFTAPILPYNHKGPNKPNTQRHFVFSSPAEALQTLLSRRGIGRGILLP